MIALGSARFLIPMAAAAAAAMIAVLTAYLLWTPDAPLLDPNDMRLVARGEAIYQEHCASCHGRDLEGQPDWRRPDQEGYLPAPPHDETGHTWHHPDQLLFEITKRGVVEAAGLKDYKSRMPVFGGMLSNEEIIAVLSYIKSRWPEEMRLRHDRLNQVFREAKSGGQ